MSSAYIAPLVPLPIVITAPGEYLTRAGERVTIKTATTKNAFDCRGQYACGLYDAWHRSGRLYAGLFSANDIVSRLHRHAGRLFVVRGEFPDTADGQRAANAAMTADPTIALLCIESGRVILAALADKGIAA